MLWLTRLNISSDLTLMRADQYIKIGKRKLNSRVTKFGGTGSESNNNMGEIATVVVIDNMSYLMRIHVLSDTLTQHSLIIGTDFLNTIKLSVKERNISIPKINNNDNQIPKLFRIEFEAETEGLDLFSCYRSEMQTGTRTCPKL